MNGTQPVCTYLSEITSLQGVVYRKWENADTTKVVDDDDCVGFRDAS